MTDSTIGPTTETVIDLFGLGSDPDSGMVNLDVLEGDAELEEHEGAPPALTVVRTAPSGDRSVIRVERRQEGMSVRSSHDHPRRDQRGLRPTAINALLAEVHPGEITEFRIGPQEKVEPHELAARLLLTNPTELDDTTEWPYDIGDRLESELLYEDLGSRPIFINDERWYPVPVRGRDAPVLLRQPADDPEIVEAHESWVGLGFSESASMTSGYDGWSLGRACDDDVLIQIRNPDDEASWVSCWADPGNVKIERIVAWLTDLSGPGDFTLGDLIMLAVETLIGVGASAGQWGELPEAAFMDGGSETAMYSLALSLDADEVDGFLDCVSRAGRQDAIDAVRDPDSPPGQRRAMRLASVVDDDT